MQLINVKTFAALLLSTTLPLTACVAEDELGDDAPIEDEDFDTGTETSELSTGWPVPDGNALALSTVALYNCTGVVIGKRDVITAAHCSPAVNQPVNFYDGADQTGASRSIVSVTLRPGVNPATEDYTDTSGKFADIAYLRLNADIPAGVRIARLPLSYPGNDAQGYRVGTGNHNGYNPTRMMYYDNGKTYSDHINDGHFLINEADADGGDSGGPFYIYEHNGSSWAYEVQGVLYGHVWEWAMRGKYTSTLHHLGWLASRLYQDPNDFITWRPGDQRHFGTVLESFFLTDDAEDRDICALACKQRSECVGVNVWRRSGDDQCQLMAAISSTLNYASYSSANRIR